MAEPPKELIQAFKDYRNLERIAVALEALVQAQRKPVRYEYAFALFPTDREMHKWLERGFRVAIYIPGPEHGGQFLMERPVYEAEEGK